MSSHRIQQDLTACVPVVTMIDLVPELAACLPDLQRAFQAIVDLYDAEGCLYLCGNGGSLSDALHLSGELLKS